MITEGKREERRERETGAMKKMWNNNRFRSKRKPKGNKVKKTCQGKRGMTG